ncbi:MAG: hypothetical protein JXB49_05915 [Bacteroidales bacterium]|nr:hypothetical protein [Bacteroidales bacterium]
MKQKLKEVTVLIQPLTKILVPVDADEEEVRTKWLAKYNNKKPLTDEQVRREFYAVRGGKMSQFKNMKK